MYEPECPDRVVAIRPVSLPGWRRSFNKWSRVRGCLPHLSRFPEFDVPELFRPAHLNRSMVLGTERDPNASIDGMAIVYDSDVVLADLDEREGYWPDRPDEMGYTRERVVLSDGTEAWAYLSWRQGYWYTGDLGLDVTARVLLRATPTVTGPKEQGVGYLRGVQRVLDACQIRDAYVDALTERVNLLQNKAEPRPS